MKLTENFSLKELTATSTGLPNVPSDNEIEKLQNSFANSKKVMVLVGQMATDKMLNDLLIQLSQFNNTIVLSESTANIHHPNFIENIDRCIMPMKEEELKDFFPDPTPVGYAEDGYIYLIVAMIKGNQDERGARLVIGHPKIDE